MFNFSPEVMQQIMQFVQQRFGPQAGQGFQQRFGAALSAPMDAPQPGAPGVSSGEQQPVGFWDETSGAPPQPPMGLSQPFGGPAQPSPQRGGFSGVGWDKQRTPGFGAQPAPQQGNFGGMRAPGFGSQARPQQGFGFSSGAPRQQPAMGLGNLAPQPPSIPGVR
jgi:hypothetical protein